MLATLYTIGRLDHPGYSKRTPEGLSFAAPAGHLPPRQACVRLREQQMVRYFLSFVVLVAAGLAGAQDNYPSKPIQMVVPFPPGGVADITGRPTALVMSKLLKQPIVIVNKPGAGGAIGMATVAHGQPDGYTLLMALSSVSIIPVAEKLQGRTPSYSLKELSP